MRVLLALFSLITTWRSSLFAFASASTNDYFQYDKSSWNRVSINDRRNERNLAIGDFEVFNNLLQSATLFLPDTIVSQSVVGITLTLDISNLRCTNVAVGDVTITYSYISDQMLTYGIEFIELDLMCYLDYKYDYGFFSGSGSADVATDNNQAKTVLAFTSSNFQDSPPSSSAVESCDIAINIADLDFHGGFVSGILDTVESLLRGTIEREVTSAVCTEVNALGMSFATNYLALAKATLDPYLVTLSGPDADALYTEQNLIPPESVRLLDFQDKNNTVVGWFDKALTFANASLGTMIQDETTGIQELGINTFLRKNFLQDDGSLVIDVQSLVENTVLYSASDKLTDTVITLNSVKIFGLDTMTRFEPLIDIGHYTLQNKLSWKFINIQLELTIDIEASTAADSIVSDPSAEGIVENIKIDFGVDAVDAVVSLLLAIDEDILGNLELASLLTSKNIMPCLLATLFQVNMTELNVQVANVREPVMSGFISPGIDRVASDTVKAAFLMYEATILKALPNMFQTKVKDVVNKNIIQTYLTKEGNVGCPIVAFQNGPVDFRDLFLKPNSSVVQGGSGSAPYGDLGSTLKTFLQDMLSAVGNDGAPKLNSFLVQPLTKSQSGTPGSLRFPKELFSVVKDDMDNPLVLAFIQSFRLEASDVRINNVDTLTFPLEIAEPTSDGNIISNSFNLGPTPGKDLNATMRLVWAIVGEDSPLNMKQIFDVSIAVPASSVAADIRAMMDGVAFGQFPLKDLLDLNCWLSTFPAVTLDAEGKRSDLSEISTLGLTRFLMNLTDLKVAINCVNCSSTGISILPDVLQIQETMGSWGIVRKRVETFLMNLIQSDWLQLQMDRLVSDAPSQCPHNELYDGSAKPKRYGLTTIPNLSREEIETIVFAGGLGAELAILSFAQTHLDMQNTDTSPLAAQENLSPTLQASSLNWTDLSGTIGSFANVAMDEARNYFSGMVEDTVRGNKDVGLNVFLRKFFLDENGVWSIPLDDVGFDKGGVNLTLPVIRLIGLDTLSRAILFEPLDGQTVSNTLEFGKFAVELDLVLELEGEAKGPEMITIAINIENLNLSIPLLLAIDSNKIGDIKLGTFLRTEDILPCVLATVNGLEIPQIVSSAGSFKATITGFLVESLQQSLSASLEMMIETYQDDILQAIPKVFQETGRGLLNNIIPAFIKKKAGCSAYPLVNQSQLIDFRDLFLSQEDALKAGGHGDSPYGTLAGLIKELLNTEFLDSSSDSFSKINEAIIRPLTKSQSGINGTFLLPMEIAGLSSDTAAALGVETIRLAFANVTMSNLDSLSNPVVLLEPNKTQGTLLNNKATLGRGAEPLSASLRLLLELTGDPMLSMRNEIEVGIEVSNINAAVVLMMRMRENGLYTFPLRDIANLDCWIATLATPVLDKDGIRTLGIDPGLAIDYLSLVIETLRLNFTCASCTSSGLAYLPDVMNILEDAGAIKDMQPRLFLLASDILKSDFVQVFLDRLLARAPQKCPHSPDLTLNATNLLKYKHAGFPELSHKSLESIIYAGSIIVESVMILLAKSHENYTSSLRDPLSGQNALKVAKDVHLLDFSLLNKTIGEWADSAINEANKYLGGDVDSKNGSKDLGINVLMRSLLLDEDGLLAIGFDDLSLNEGKMKVALKEIRITGMDTFTEFNAFDAIGPQTLQNKFGWKTLGVELVIEIEAEDEASNERRLLTEVEQLTVTFGVEDLQLSFAVLLAMDQEILGALTMGSMLKTSQILPCILSASKGAEITELDVSISGINGLSFVGFVSDEVNEAISRSTQALLKKYSAILVDSMPAIFDSTVRTAINNWISYYLNQESSDICLRPSQSTNETGIVDLRDLLLPQDISRSLGGSGNLQYGNLFRGLLDIINKEVLGIDGNDSTTKVNSLLIAPLTKSQSSVPGLFRYKGDLMNTGSRIVVGGFDAKIDLRAYDARIENLDSVGAPLSILNPLSDRPYNLNNSATFGVGERPLRFAVRFLISLLGGGDIHLRNEVDISLDLTAATVVLETFLKVADIPFLEFPLKDIQNLNCWLATLPSPILDSRGIRELGSSVSAALFHLAISLKNLKLNITCISCSSPEMEELSKLLSTPEAAIDVMMVANKILDFATRLLGGEFLQVQIDRMLVDAPAKCPHSAAYDPQFVAQTYKSFEAVDRKEESAAFIVTILIVIGCLIVLVMGISLFIKFIVHRRSKTWVRTLSNERVKLLHQLQLSEQEKERELNHATTSMFHSKDIPSWVRYFIPVVVVVNVGFFLSGHLNLGASVNIVAKLAGETIAVENFFEFSLANSTIDIWKAGGKELAILIVLLSGVWPYTKQFVTFVLWFLPPKRVSITRRGSIFLWLDVLAKWSMVDIFVLIVSITAFRVSVQSPNVSFLPDNFYSIDLLVVPKWGLYANLIAQLMTQICSHFIIHYHRRMVERATVSYESRVIGGNLEGGWNDDDEQIKSPGSICNHIDDTKECLRTHTFSRPHRGESDKLQVRCWVSKCLVAVTALLSLLILLGCILPSFSLEVLGILGVVVESGQQFEQAVTDHSVFTIIHLLMGEARFLGGAGNYIGLALLSILLILTVLIVPILQALVLLYQWFSTISHRRRNRTSILVESLQAWQYAEVYVISLIVAAWQLGPVSEFMINSYCDGLSNSFATLVFFGVLSEDDAQCFRVQATIKSATYILIVAAILLGLLTAFVMRAVKQYDFDNSWVIKSLCYTHDKAVEESPIEEEEMEEARNNIRPVPVLFTDSFRWFCRREVDVRNEFGKLGITETFAVSAQSGKEEVDSEGRIPSIILVGNVVVPVVE